MATISTSIELYDKVSAPIYKMLGALGNLTDAFMSVETSMDGSFDPSQIEAARRKIEEASLEVIQLGNEFENTGKKSKRTSSDIDSLGNKIMGLVGAYASLQGVQKVISLADEYTQTNARLGMIVDSQNTVEELQDKIYASAQRSRASYADTADMVAKLSQRTGDLFSNDEAIVFAENLNKLYTIAGASQEEMKSSQLQLTQALGSGVLRGEEFNAVFEAAPNVMQTVADYMNVPIGSLRDMAAEGQITGDIIKNAILGASTEINTQFENMPMTWAQIWTACQNALYQAFEPLLQVIAGAATWISDNWSTIEPIFWGIAAAVGVVAGAFAIWKVVTLAQTVAQWALNSALLANPLTWIVIAIAAVVGAIVYWINKMGGLKIAWLLVVNALLIAWDWVKIGFFTGVYWVIDLWDKMALTLRSAGVTIANFMGDMKVSVLTILQNMINGAIDILNGFIKTINKIPGVSIDLIGKVTFATKASLENEAEKQARNKDLKNYRAEIESGIAERDAKLSAMKAEATRSAAERQAEISATRAEIAASESAPDPFEQTIADLEKQAENTGSIADDTGAIKDSMEITSEELKYLRDIAERDVVNRFTTAEIKVEMNNSNSISSNMDLDGVIDYLANGVNDAMEKAAEGVHG